MIDLRLRLVVSLYVFFFEEALSEETSVLEVLQGVKRAILEVRVVNVDKSSNCEYVIEEEHKGENRDLSSTPQVRVEVVVHLGC